MSLLGGRAGYKPTTPFFLNAKYFGERIFKKIFKSKENLSSYIPNKQRQLGRQLSATVADQTKHSCKVIKSIADFRTWLPLYTILNGKTPGHHLDKQTVSTNKH